MKVEIDTKTARYLDLLKECQKDHNVTTCLNCPSSCRLEFYSLRHGLILQEAHCDAVHQFHGILVDKDF